MIAASPSPAFPQETECFEVKLPMINAECDCCEMLRMSEATKTERVSIDGREEDRRLGWWRALSQT